jgi:hypothetical protein
MRKDLTLHEDIIKVTDDQIASLDKLRLKVHDPPWPYLIRQTSKRCTAHQRGWQVTGMGSSTHKPEQTTNETQGLWDYSGIIGLSKAFKSSWRRDMLQLSVIANAFNVCRIVKKTLSRKM